MYIISVLVEHPTSHLDQTYDYLSTQELVIGIRVKITFGKQHLIGYVEKVSYRKLSKEELEAEAGFSYRYIEDVIDDTCLLNEELTLLADNMTKMTLSPKIACLQAMLPNQLKPSTTRSHNPQEKYQTYVYLRKEKPVKGSKQKEIITLLQQKSPRTIQELNATSSSIKRLEELGIVKTIDKATYREISYQKIQSKDIQLTPKQQQIVSSIINAMQGVSTHLIHGVTGSGKTEIYLRLSEYVVSQGKNVIVLVPEISLTPKMVSVFKEKFGELVAVLHSRLSKGERYDEYRKISNQEVRVVVGARSAIFAPLTSIGLILMDEEHDASYKQESSPRYHTKDIALLRAKYHHCPLVLGSATPCIESYARAKNGHYILHTLNQRINKQALPNYQIVDMANERRSGQYGLFSASLISAIQKRIDKEEQIVLLLNRRGYANYILCKECGYSPKCPHCDVTLTYHKHNQQLKCHYCDYQEHYLPTCPSCHSRFVNEVGFGTQKVEEELKRQFPMIRVIRFDVDTTSKKNAHQKLLTAFENHEADVLLGTQMIAKGLDIENVTLVGVIDADSSLNIPDFRSNERTFQLITQVAGRSGRGNKQGEVIIQTYNPYHYAIELGASQDYIAFFHQEISYRKLAKYPPFCYLISIIIQSKKEEEALHSAEDITTILKSNMLNAQVLGPSKAMLFKIKDEYRYRILIKYTIKEGIFDIVKHIYDKYRKSKTKVMIDVNPYSQL